MLAVHLPPNSKSDFYFAAADQNQLPAVQGVGAPSFVHGIQVEGTTDKVGSLKHSHRLYDGDGKTISFSQHTSLKAEVKEKFKNHDVGWKIHNARLDDIRTSVPDVWLLSADNLYRSLYEWRTGPLQRLANLLTNRFLSQQWEFNYRDKPQQMPKKIELLHTFFNSAVSEFPFLEARSQTQARRILVALYRSTVSH